ncbi:threonine/serine exporter family protein [Clostridium sp.]|uniref:threonine/serine exporter family protein n=1 Tax=Clostridium sp. TaxID=1506 RepID=UPI003993F852
MEKIFIESFFSGIATLAFAVMFNIRGKFLIWAGIGGFFSWFCYLVSLAKFGNTTMAMFIASICLSVYSEILARKLKTPVTTLVICALMPLVPGSGMYYTMYSAVSGDMTKTWTLAASTLSSAGVLALGVILVSTLTRLLKNFKDDKVSIVKKRITKTKSNFLIDIEKNNDEAKDEDNNKKE